MGVDSGSRRGSNESVEKCLLLRILTGSVLRVPLNSDDPFGSGPLDGFDDPIITATGDDETVPEGIHSLVVEGKTRFWAHGGHGLRRPRSCDQFDRVGYLSMTGQIQMLNQSSATDDVEHLMAAADGEHRLAEIQDCAHCGELDCIVRFIDAVEMIGFSGSPVASRVDVTSTMKDDGIAALDEVADIIDQVDDRRQDQRHRARSHKCILITIAGAEPGRSETLGLGDLAADDESDG